MSDKPDNHPVKELHEAPLTLNDLEPSLEEIAVGAETHSSPLVGEYEYRKFVRSAAFYNNVGTGNALEYSYIAAGLAGECGEAVDVIKKCLRQGVFEDNIRERREQLIDELGDMMWYLTRMLDVLQVSPAQVRTHNVHKLTTRHGKKWDRAAQEMVTLEGEFTHE